MITKQQLSRARLLLLLLGAAFAGLGYRLADLQVIRHQEFSAKAEDNTLRESWQAPRRGDILDVHGNILATSVPMRRVCADPSLMGGYTPLVARTLAPLLGLPESEVLFKLTPRLGRNPAGEVVTNGLHYVRLAKPVSEDKWQQIYAAMTNLSVCVDEKRLSRAGRGFLRNFRLHSVFAEPDQARKYPNDALAGQVIGFSAAEDVRVSGHIISQITGRDGVEASMNKQLSGVAGWKVTEQDRARNELVALRDEDVKPRDGLDVVLTIDSAVQHIVESELGEAMGRHTPKSITCVVMRPRTGEILAMVSLPNYDPNRPQSYTPEMRNRVITDVVEPGSTFKIIVASGALNEGTARLADRFFCENGHFAYGGRVLHDHDPYGWLTLKEIIEKSSNIGAAKIGIERLGAQKLYDYAWDFGIGQRTGIVLPGELKGLFYPVKQWTKVSLAQIPMGHGLAATRSRCCMRWGRLPTTAG